MPKLLLLFGRRKFVLIKSSVTRVCQAGVSEAIDGSEMPVEGSVM